ncbi:MAG: class I SAM-dependent methyltransferase [Chthoniobacterales bacterium]
MPNVQSRIKGSKFGVGLTRFAGGFDGLRALNQQTYDDVRKDSFSPEAIRGSDRGYAAFHAKRFAYLLDELEQIAIDSRTRVLDIGPSRLTELIRAKFDIQVDSLGFDEDSNSAGGNHYQFDLNNAQNEKTWRRGLPEYDVVVMAEVIEHLHTAPELVLAFVRTLIAPDGWLIIQTPNAAALPKRIKLLLGQNPYEMIRTQTSNPGHFREYTLPELRRIVSEAGFNVVRTDVRWYFDGRFAHHGEKPRYQPIVGRMKNLFYRMLPGTWQYGITLLAQRRA